MKDEFSNRLTMFKTARDLLNLPELKVVWFNQNPTIFTTKVAALDPAIAAIEEYCRKHGVDLTGIAVDKDLEETDVETVGHKLSRLMLDYSRDQGDHTTAAKCKLSPSDWRGLRDTALILKAREIRDLALPIAATPLGFSYGITSSLVQKLTDEVKTALREAEATLPADVVISANVVIPG